MSTRNLNASRPVEGRAHRTSGFPQWLISATRVLVEIAPAV